MAPMNVSYQGRTYTDRATVVAALDEVLSRTVSPRIEKILMELLLVIDVEEGTVAL